MTVTQVCVFVNLCWETALPPEAWNKGACMRPMYVILHPCSDVWYKQHLRTAGREFEDEGILPPKHPQSDWDLHRCRSCSLYCDAIYGNGKSATVSEKGATTLYHCRGCWAWAGQSYSHTILSLMTPWFYFSLRPFSLMFLLSAWKCQTIIIYITTMVQENWVSVTISLRREKF